MEKSKRELELEKMLTEEELELFTLGESEIEYYRYVQKAEFIMWKNVYPEEYEKFMQSVRKDKQELERENGNWLEYEYDIDNENNKEEYQLHETEAEYIKESGNIIHKHDKAIKNILLNKQVVADFINDTMNLQGENKIKQEELQEYKTDFITQDYFNREVDIIFKDLRQKNTFFMIEHQSKIDYKMPMRFVEYYCEIMRSTYKNRGRRKRYQMPTVFAIVLYIGNKKWNAKTKAKMEKSVRNLKVPVIGEYKIVDTNEYTNKQLREEKGVLGKIVLLEKVANEEMLEQEIEQMMNMKITEEEIEQIKQYIYYIIGDKFGKEISNKILKNINEKEEESKSMLVDVLEKIEARGRKIGREEGETIGIAKGETIGRAKGEKIAKIKFVKKLLEIDMPKKKISELTELSIKEIEQINNK